MDWNSSPTVKTSVRSGCATRSINSHCRRFVSWNSSTMTMRKRSCVASRTSASSRSRSRAASWRSSKSTADSRRFAAAYSVAKRSSSSCSRSRSCAASSSSAARSAALRADSNAAARTPRVANALRSTSFSGREPAVATRSASPALRRCVSVADGSPVEQLCLGAKTREGVVDARTLAELEHERSTRGAERLVDAREHPPQAVCAVGREQSEPLGLFAGAERFERTRERLAAQHHRACIHELPEARVEAGRERMRAQKPVAEAVNRGDPRRVELTGEVGPPALAQRGSDARAELTRSLPRVGDDQDRVHVDAALADGTHVALDEHRRLAGAGASRDEHRPLRLDRSELVIVE